MKAGLSYNSAVETITYKRTNDLRSRNYLLAVASFETALIHYKEPLLSQTAILLQLFRPLVCFAGILL